MSAIIDGFFAVLSWPTFLFVILGTLIGITFGALPGLGGTVAIALLVPLSFGLPPEWAFPLFLATLGGVAFGGSTSAILANIPGTAPNAATLLDGYPMAREGRASEAIGVSATASALGAMFGVVVLILIIPVSREIILAFGPPEFFWLVVAGLVLIARVSEGSLVKDLIAGAFGIMLGFVGFSIFGTFRYGFGIRYLWDGLPVVPTILGLFAIAEAIKLSTQGGTIAKGTGASYDRRGAIKGALFVVKHPRLLLQSSVIGTLVGMVPGAGGVIATFLAYGQGGQTAKDGETFGTGNPKGVLCAEAANDSKDGGGLLPTVVFGIPGSLVMVVILGAFTIHGLVPGKEMLTTNVNILYMMIFALLFSNILTSTLGMVFADQIAKFTRVPVKVLIAPILVTSLIGAFAINRAVGDIVVTIVFGLIGYAMLTNGYSRVAFMLGIILGPLFEKSLAQSLAISDVGYFILFSRPIAFFIFLVVVVSLLLPMLRKEKEKLLSHL